MKKLLMTLSSVTLIAPTATTAIVFSQNSSPLLPNNDNPVDNFDDDLDSQLDLNTDLINTDLGILDKINNAEIIELIKFKNPLIADHELEVGITGPNYAQIKPTKTSRTYKQSLVGVMVNFEVKQKQALNNLNLKLNLGEIESAAPDAILETLQTFNPSLNVQEVEIVEPSIANESALIKAKFNGIYLGQVVVKYELAAKPLKADLVNKDLGMVLNNDETTLRKRLLEFNPNLQLGEIKLSKITENSFIVQGIIGGTYYSSTSIIGVTFQLPEHSIKKDLEDFNYNLGEIETNKIADLKTALKIHAKKLNLDEIEIFHITGNSFEIKAKTNSNDYYYYYRLEPAITINFFLPEKVSLNQIETFKLVNYRTKNEVEKEIQELILLKTKKTNVKLNKDYVINFRTKLQGNEIVPVQVVEVKAINGQSPYLTGSFSFEIINPLTLVNNRDSYKFSIRHETSAEKEIKELIKAEVEAEIQKQNIMEDWTTAFNNLTILAPNSKQKEKSIYYPYIHSGKNYYQKMVFEFGSNKIFSNEQIIWDNIAAPLYYSFEITNLPVDKNYSISYVDSTQKYGGYPKAKYVNSDHYPKRDEWQYSPAITFASFDVKKLFNYNSVNEFFDNYDLNFQYRWVSNNWASKWNWQYDWGSDINKLVWNDSSKTWKKYDENNQNEKEFSDKKMDKKFFDNTFGEIYSGRKAVGAIHNWIEVKGTTVIIKGQTISAYYWTNGSAYNHAVFALLQGNDIRFYKK